MKIEKKLPGENARMYAHRIILDNIINLELPPGSAISENDLSVSLNLSRTPVREALIEMTRLDLVKIYPQKGSFVSKIDYDLIEESKFIRLSLELAALRLLCEQGIPADVLALFHKNLEAQRRYVQNPGVYNTMLELDNEFHKLIFQAVNKQRTYEFIRTQMVHFDRLRVLAYRMLKTEKNEQTLNDHENIMYAMEKRDAELAEMVMSRHLTRHLFDKNELDRICPVFFE